MFNLLRARLHGYEGDLIDLELRTPTPALYFPLKLEPIDEDIGKIQLGRTTYPYFFAGFVFQEYKAGVYHYDAYSC